MVICHGIFITLAPGANVIKLFTTVIYCHSRVIPSFCVITWYYYGNYCGMLVSNTIVIYHGILTLEKVGTAVNYHGIFITLAKNTRVF
jgi:hypothetical protein